MSMNNDYLSIMVEKIAKQKEALILEQINDLVKRNLLVVEMGEMILIQDPDKHEIQLRQQIRLTLKDKEYIEKLEEENTLLKSEINNLRDCAAVIIERSQPI